jgi:SAM-dependent methyltransferase
MIDFLRTIRRSKRPEKQLMWIWFALDMRGSKGFRNGLDLPCGSMGCRRFFRTQTYTGVDLNRDHVAAGLSTYPEATGITGPIEELPEGLQGDWVVCLQTIGHNNAFQSANTMQAVRSVVDAVVPGGVLILNACGDPLTEYGDEMDALLEQSFKTVKRRTYGAFTRRHTQRGALLSRH